MTGRSPWIAVLLVTAASWTARPAAQAPGSPAQDGTDVLRQQIERRFEVLPLRDGIALRPRSIIRDVRLIELTDRTIAIDGAAVTGPELRNRLGEDAELVLQLSYLTAEARRALFAAGSPGTPAAAPPAAPVEAPDPQSPDSTAPRDNRDASDDRRTRSRPDWQSGDDIVRFGQSIRIASGEVIDGDVVAIGGSITVDGRVRGDVVVIGGSLELGPQAVVEKDVAAVGGVLRRAPGSRVDGRVREVGFGAAAGDWFGPRQWFDGWSSRFVSSTFALASTVTRFAVLCLLAALVVLLAGGYLEPIGMRVSHEPLKAGAIGLLAQVLFVPLLIITVVVLVVTLVGIPLLLLLPFAILALGIVALVGFTAVAKQIGERVGQRFGWINPGVYLMTFAGIATVLLPVLLARLALLAGGTGVSFLWHAVAVLGYLVEYAVWTVGFGAVTLMRFGKSPFAGGSQLTTLSPHTGAEG